MQRVLEASDHAANCLGLTSEEVEILRPPIDQTLRDQRCTASKSELFVRG
ncbi:MAG: hypothetical protein ACYDD6_12925 [Acidimicrobiales bacterium]